MSELCPTALQQLNLLIIKVLSSPKNAMKSQKKYGYGVFKNNYFISEIHIPGNTILKETSFLKNLTTIPNGNLILRYLFKLVIRLGTNKLIYPE